MESVAWRNMIGVTAKINVYATKCKKHCEECSTYHGVRDNQLRNPPVSLWLHAGYLYICSYLKQHAITSGRLSWL